MISPQHGALRLTSARRAWARSDMLCDSVMESSAVCALHAFISARRACSCASLILPSAPRNASYLPCMADSSKVLHYVHTWIRTARDNHCFSLETVLIEVAQDQAVSQPRGRPWNTHFNN